MSQLRDRSSRGLTLVKAEVTENTSGYLALDYKVIVKKDAVQDTTEGGIVVPEDVKKLERWSVVEGCVVDFGDRAFTDGRRPDGEFYQWGRKPKVGTRVLLREYEGVEFPGDDGETYVLLADNDIGAMHE